MPAPITPVIMCGGAGSRLWPLSTAAKPKPFHTLHGERTLFQQTALRVADGPDLAFAAPVIVGGRAHAALLAGQLAEIGVEAGLLVLEPFGRSTAAVAAIAARLSDGPVLLLPADHAVADAAAFRAAVARGLGVPDRIVTLGITPESPETGFGYIQRGEVLAPGVHAIVRFAEKPSRPVAEAYVADGGYLWNAGVFLFAPAVMLAELAAHRPDVLAAVDEALAAAGRDGHTLALPDDAWAAVPPESIDIAVMERTALGAVAPCAPGWADIGAFDALWRLGSPDADGNVLRGDAVARETRGSLVWADGPIVAVLGLTDVCVVATRDAVVVLPRERAQEVRDLLAAVTRDE